jgi:hypothetical protein
LPGIHRKPRVGSRGKLTEAHSQFLIEYIDKNPTSVLVDIKENSARHFRVCLFQCQRCISTWFINAK